MYAYAHTHSHTWGTTLCPPSLLLHSVSPSQRLRSFSFSYQSGAHFFLTNSPPPPPPSNLSPHPINSISQIFLGFIYFYLSSLPFPILGNNHYPTSYITIPYQLVFLHPVLPPPVPSHTVPNSSHYIFFLLTKSLQKFKNIYLPSYTLLS